jgi:type I restriction enzyme, S subunit
MSSQKVPKGYKQTEVGVIPEDWEVKFLGEILSFQNGVNADKKAYGLGIPFINVLEVITYSCLNVAQIPGKIVLSPQAIKNFKVEFGDILFNRTSETQEEVGLASVYLDHGDVVFGGFVIRGRLKNANLDSIFASYLLRSPNIHSQIASRGQGAIRTNIGQQELSKVSVTIPPIEEQKLIARALSDIDALIEALEGTIGKKRHIKQGAMQELLTGERRLGGFSGEWIKTTLGKVCSHIIDGTHYTPKYVESGIPFYSVETITDDNFSDTKFISHEEHQNLIKRCKPERGDILMTRIGSLGKTKLIDWDVNASIYVSLALLKLNDQISAEYIYRYTQSEKFIKDLEQRSLIHAAPKKINLDQMSGIPIYVPIDALEQTAIATILSDMDTEIATLEAKLTKTRQLKQGMMHELLTGRIRLVEEAQS